MKRLTSFLGAALLALTARAEPDPYILVLGTAQDAGYPQAGCYEPHCLPGWNDPARRRTPGDHVPDGL